MTDTATTNPTDRPPETRRLAETNHVPAPTNGRIQLQQAADVTAQAVGTAVKAVATAAGKVPPRQYFAIALRICGFIGLFVVYQTIEAEGLREIFGEVVSKRLFKAAPYLLGWMANFEETRKLDMANALAAALLVFTYLSWEAVVYRLVHRPAGEATVERYLILVPAALLLVVDTILFAAGVYANGSFSTPFPAAMLALAYDAMLVLFSLWVVKIERKKT